MATTRKKSLAPAISVIAPCFNEEGNIPELVDRVRKVMRKTHLDLELILVDDGSTDGTKTVISALAKTLSFIRPVYHTSNNGMEAAWKSGLAAANGEYICLIDADLQYQPEDIIRLYREISFSRADIVQGYRSSIGRLRNSRYTLSIGLNFLLNLLFGVHAKDNKSGFILTRKDVLTDILAHTGTYHYYQTFITAAAHAKGYTVREVETLFTSRLAGTSFIAQIPFLVIVRSCIDLARAYREFRTGSAKNTVIGSFVAGRTCRRQTAYTAGWRNTLRSAYRLTMPLHHWMIGSTAFSYWQELEKTQWLTNNEIRELQEIKLRMLVNHAYRHVGYWRNLFDSLKLKPDDIRSVDDLRFLPLLSKPDIRQNLYFDMLSDNYRKKNIQRIATSGSTGEPFTCFVDKTQLEYRFAATLRGMEWTGWTFGDRQMRLWHQTIGMTPVQVAKEMLDARFTRRAFVPAYEMDEAHIDAFVGRLREYHPVLIDGYAESFNFLANYIKYRGGISGVHPKAIMTSAQALPDQSRRAIEKEFGCRVFDKYGSREFSGIAYECDAHRGHHVIAENYIVEVLANGRPAKPGELGEIVITDLNNYCMPFIRYRIGDLAVAMDSGRACKCGRGLPMIGRIEGRVQAIIRGTNGTFLPGTFFAHLFKDYDYAVRQYQVIQEREGEVVLLIVKAQRFTDEAFFRILADMKRYLGKDMVVRTEFMESIPMVRTGKQQGSISKLSYDYQRIRNAAARNVPEI